MKKQDKLKTITVKRKKRILDSKKKLTNFSKATSSSFDKLISLQNSIGNQAVQKLFRSCVIQAKPKIGKPGDKYEQEADKVANQVMNMPEPHLQRQVEPEEEENVQAKLSDNNQILRQEAEPEEEEAEAIQTKHVKGQMRRSSGRINPQFNTLKSGGKLLPKSTRKFFEERMGSDFSQVRVHDDTLAAETAKSINAKAFTLGKNVAFGAGQYKPETKEGKKLLAHELTHCIQQKQFSSKGKISNTLMRQPKLTKSEDLAEPLGNIGANIPKPLITKIKGAIAATIYFGQNRFLLDAANFMAIEKLREELGYIFRPIIIVDGHASTEGTDRFNLNLSKRRREAVIALLSSELKTKVKFEGMPYGELKVAVAETAEKGDPELEKQRSLNRRVEIKIISSPIFEPKKPIDLSLPVKPPSAEEELNRSIKILNELDKKGELKPFKQKIGAKDVLDKVLDKINVPEKYRGLIIKGIEAVGEKALDKYLDQTDLNKNEKKMIKKLIDGLYKYQVEF